MKSSLGNSILTAKIEDTNVIFSMVGRASQIGPHGVKGLVGKVFLKQVRFEKNFGNQVISIKNSLWSLIHDTEELYTGSWDSLPIVLIKIIKYNPYYQYRLKLAQHNKNKIYNIILYLSGLHAELCKLKDSSKFYSDQILSLWLA